MPDEETLRQAIHRLIEKHGAGAVALQVAEWVGWQGRWYPLNQAARIAKATESLVAAADILIPMEREEEAKT